MASGKRARKYRMSPYSKRKESVEAMIGQIKHMRGFRQFLLRGLENVKAEWHLICLAHNVLKMWRSGRSLPALAQKWTREGKSSLLRTFMPSLPLSNVILTENISF